MLVTGNDRIASVMVSTLRAGRPVAQISGTQSRVEDAKGRTGGRLEQWSDSPDPSAGLKTLELQEGEKPIWSRCTSSLFCGVALRGVAVRGPASAWVLPQKPTQGKRLGYCTSRFKGGRCEGADLIIRPHTLSTFLEPWSPHVLDALADHRPTRLTWRWESGSFPPWLSLQVEIERS